MWHFAPLPERPLYDGRTLYLIESTMVIFKLEFGLERILRQMRRMRLSLVERSESLDAARRSQASIREWIMRPRFTVSAQWLRAK